MSPRTTKVVDGYIRVSRRGAREDDRFISPRLQDETIRRWAKANGCKVGLIPEPDIDVSGAKAPKDRALGELIDRVRERKSDGVVVAKLDRFGRDVVHVHEAVKGIREAGGRFVAVDDGIDTNTEGSQFHLGMLALVAEWERDRRRASFAASITSAIERGVHVGPTPVGYVRTSDRRLSPDPKVAPAVVRVFRGRAEGTSWRNLARAFNAEMEQLGRDERVSHSGLSGLVKSKTYRASSFMARTSCATRTRRSSPRTSGMRRKIRARRRSTTGRSRSTANSWASHAAPPAGERSGLRLPGPRARVKRRTTAWMTVRVARLPPR